MAWRAWLPDKAPPAWQSILLGVAFGAVAVAVRLCLQTPLGAGLLLVTLFPALMFAAALGGLPGGLACLAVATLGATFLLPHPATSLAWLVGAIWIAGGLIVLVTAALAGNVRQLRLNEAEFADMRAQLQTVAGELAHRNRNALYVIKAIVSQSARTAPSAEAAERIINARLDALLRAQDVVVQSNGDSAALSAVLEKAVAPFGPERFVIAPGPEAEVEAQVAVGLGLLFHEMATNALKYGALSARYGRVEVDWSMEGEFALLRWREVGGPAVAPPTKVGFGSRLLAAALLPQGGKVEPRFEPEGFVCELRVPSRHNAFPGARSATFAKALGPDIDVGTRIIHWES